MTGPVELAAGSRVDGEHPLGVLDALLPGVLVLLVVGGEDEERSV